MTMREAEEFIASVPWRAVKMVADDLPAWCAVKADPHGPGPAVPPLLCMECHEVPHPLN
jgi:hypothetical protein